MKIALLRKRYTFHGGAEGFSQAMMLRLAAEGHEIHVFAIEWDGGELPPNIHLHRIPVPSWNSLLRDLLYAVRSGVALKASDFDIVQSHDKTLSQDIYRAGDGCHVEWLRQRWGRTGFFGKLSILLNPYHWMILLLERAILRGHRFRRIIAISEMVKRDVMRNYGVSEGDISLIYNPVDLERFHPRNRDLYRSRVRQEHGIGDNETVALFVGSGFERKGVRYLLEAVKGIQEPVTVLVVGRGDGRALSGAAAGQRVVFCGPRKNIERYYAAADMFVFPTLYEPFGNVHLEALASGLPVITTVNSGAAEIITDGEEGYVVRAPEEIGALSSAMERLLHPARRAEMAKKARQRAEQFTFERYHEQVMRLYDEVVAMKNAGGRA